MDCSPYRTVSQKVHKEGLMATLKDSHFDMIKEKLERAFFENIDERIARTIEIRALLNAAKAI